MVFVAAVGDSAVIGEASGETFSFPPLDFTARGLPRSIIRPGCGFWKVGMGGVLISSGRKLDSAFVETEFVLPSTVSIVVVRSF